MLFSPLRKAVIAGAGILTVGAAGGVAVHAATTSSSSSSPTAATPSPSPGGGLFGGDRSCKRAGGRMAAAAEQVLQIAVSVTGESRDQILSQLRAGKTLDEIAGSKAATIEQQALDKLKARLDKAVSAGKLQASQESTMLDKAKTALEKAMSSDLSKRIPSGDAGADAACGAGRGNSLLRDLVKVTAQQTGLSEQQVLQDLRDGQSIDQIAGSKAAAIRAAMLQMENQKLGSLLDRLMSHQGLGKGMGHGRFGGAGSATASPSASA